MNLVAVKGVGVGMLRGQGELVNRGYGRGI